MGRKIQLMLGCLFFKSKRIFIYGVNSIIVTIIDIIIVYILIHFITINSVIANTIGILTGFIIHYYLSMNNVFQLNEKKSILIFIIYFATFLIGLAIANTIFYFSFVRIEKSFILSKSLSVIIPFFITYSSRKIIYDNLKKHLSY